MFCHETLNLLTFASQIRCFNVKYPFSIIDSEDAVAPNATKVEDTLLIKVLKRCFTSDAIE